MNDLIELPMALPRRLQAEVRTNGPDGHLTGPTDQAFPASTPSLIFAIHTDMNGGVARIVDASTSLTSRSRAVGRPLWVGVPADVGSRCLFETWEAPGSAQFEGARSGSNSPL